MTADPLAALAEVINLAGISGGNTHAVAQAVRDAGWAPVASVREATQAELIAAGWRYEPDTLRVAADELTTIYVQAMRDGCECAGIGPYATAADVVVRLRARAGTEGRTDG